MRADLVVIAAGRIIVPANRTLGGPCAGAERVGVATDPLNLTWLEPAEGSESPRADTFLVLGLLLFRTQEDVDGQDAIHG